MKRQIYDMCLYDNNYNRNNYIDICEIEFNNNSCDNLQLIKNIITLNSYNNKKPFSKNHKVDNIYFDVSFSIYPGVYKTKYVDLLTLELLLYKESKINKAIYIPFNLKYDEINKCHKEQSFVHLIKKQDDKSEFNYLELISIYNKNIKEINNTLNIAIQEVLLNII